MYFFQLENLFHKCLDQSRLEKFGLIKWNEEQSIRYVFVFIARCICINCEMYLSQWETSISQILNQNRLEDVVLIVWEEEQSISGCWGKKRRGWKAKRQKDKKQPLGNQTFSAFMDFQGWYEILYLENNRRKQI